MIPKDTKAVLANLIEAKILPKTMSTKKVVRYLNSKEFHRAKLYEPEFKEILAEITDFIIKEKGDEVISERHQKDFKKDYEKSEDESDVEEVKSTESFTDIDFEDI